MSSPRQRWLHRLHVVAALVVVVTSAGVARAGPGQVRTRQGEVDKITFAAAGFPAIPLEGPFDVGRIEFSTPAAWQLVEGSELQIDYSVAYDGPVATPVDGNDGEVAPVGRLLISMNDVQLAAVPLDRIEEGLRTFVSIPAEALNPSDPARPHELEFVLQSFVDCSAGLHPSVTVLDSSVFELARVASAPSTDLRRLPYPIYQPARLVPHATTLVVADDPTATQVQAALTVAAAFGRMSAGQLPLSLTPEAMLSDADRSANDLIFVGPFSAPGSHAVPSDPEDGIIEIIASPWNPERVMLIVTGNSEDGILKAARALSSGNIQTSATSDLALVVNASVGQLPRSVSPVRALADLGYGNVTIDRAGPSSTEYEFFIPSGQQPAGEAALELVISHATTLDYSRSTLTINVNTEQIGSIELRDGTSQSGRTQLTLPASALRSGFNTLAIAADLIPANACGETTPPEEWLTVRSESQLQIPLAPKPSSAARELALGEYPDVFAARPALDSAAFVVAAGDVVGLQVAAQIAFDLGADARGSSVTMGPTALFDDGNVLDVLTEKAPLFVGRAGRLPSIAGLSNQLPVPFTPGEDYAREVGGVVYRLPEGASIGYLEMFPWPGGDVALAVLGTDDAGLLRAAGTLLDAPALQQLSGNFAVLGADQVLAFQVDANAGSIAPSPREDGPTPEPDRPGWIVPALAVSSGLTVLVVLIVLLGAWRGRRTRD